MCLAEIFDTQRMPKLQPLVGEPGARLETAALT